MKPLLAIAALALCAIPAHADGYNVTGSASFALASGQDFSVSFSYTLTGTNLTSSISNLDSVSNIEFTASSGFGTFALFSSEPFDLQWSNSGQANNGTNPTTGLLFDLEESTNFPFVGLSLYDLNSPYGPGPAFPFAASFQAIPAPEPKALYLLGLSLPALALKRKVA